MKRLQIFALLILSLGCIAAHAQRVSQVQQSFQRPNNATAYALSDVISDSTSAPSLLTLGTSGISRGYITACLLSTDQATNTISYRLHLYNLPSIAARNDNAPFQTVSTNNAYYVGYVDVSSLSQEASGGEEARGITVKGASTLPLPFTGSLYGQLETLGAFTPASNQTFTVTIYYEHR